MSKTAIRIFYCAWIVIGFMILAIYTGNMYGARDTSNTEIVPSLGSQIVELKPYSYYVQEYVQVARDPVNERTEVRLFDGNKLHPIPAKDEPAQSTYHPKRNHNLTVLGIEVNEGFTYYDYYFNESYNEYLPIPLSEEWQKFIYSKCEQYEVNYELVLAVMGVETGWNINMEVSPNGQYYGIGMISIKYGKKGLAKHGIDLFTPEGSVEAVCLILSEKVHEFNSETLGAMAYNCGSAGAQRLINKGQTSSGYTDKVMKLRKGLYKYKLSLEGVE